MRSFFTSSLWPFILIFSLLLSGCNAATPANSRLQRSIALINPVRRRDLVLGKLLAAMPFSTINLLITLAGFAIVFNGLPMEDMVGFRVGLNLNTLIVIFLVGLPIILLACALLTLVASFTRSTKEVGSYFPFVGLTPSLPGLALAFLPVKPQLWAMLIPTFGQQILINQFMRAEAVSALNVIVSTVVTLLAAALITLAAVKLYEGERIVMGR
jgi:sodium transport system permease protein